jgi:hypothetical protein
MVGRGELTEEAWGVIAPLLPRSGGRRVEVLSALGAPCHARSYPAHCGENWEEVLRANGLPDAERPREQQHASKAA